METGPCACRVRIFTRAEGVVIVISEKPSSIRLTDTYALEQIASEVLSWAVNSADRRDTITWVAQCPPLNTQAQRDRDDLVRTGLPFTSIPVPDRFFEIKFERFLDEEKYRSEKMRFGVFAWSNWKKISLDYLESLIGTKWEA
jgi:hypothetical protein